MKRSRSSLSPAALGAFCALTLATGCDEETGATHIACVGDSITLGSNASAPQETYPGALQGMLGEKVVVKGFGHSGATALGPGAGDLPYESQPEYAAATTFVSEAGDDARVAVVLFLGTNDSKARLWDVPGSKERFKVDYAKLIDHFAGLSTHPTVYVATPLGAGVEPCCGIRGDVLVRDIVPIVKDLAKSHGATVIDLTTLITGHPELLVDGVHPTDKGYEQLASKVREGIAAAPPKSRTKRSWWSRL